MPAPSRTSLLLAIACLLGVAVWLAFQDGDRAEGVPNAASDEPAASDAAERRSNGDALPARAPAARTTAAAESDPAAPSIPASEPPLVLFGRCVDATGNPVEGGEVRTALAGESSVSLPDALPDARTTSDGQFELERSVDGDSGLAIRISAPGRVPVHAELPRPLPGERINLGDVLLRRAVSVRGRVVDDTGAPVEGVRVQFVRIELSEPPKPADVAVRPDPTRMLVATSGEGGRFEFEGPAWTGEWFIGAEYTGALIEPRNVQLGTDLSRYDLRIVVERPDPEFTIHGHVVDENGEPIEGARLMLIGHGFVGRGKSRTDGSFAVPRAGPMPRLGREGMQVDVDHVGGAFNSADGSAYRDIEWGDDGVQIVLTRRVGRAVRVLDEAGQPVLNYTLLPFFAYGESYSLRRRTRIRGFHADGRCTLPNLQRGRHAVLVIPDDPALASTALHEFEVDAGPAVSELPVMVRRRVPLRVEVAGSNSGTPQIGSHVELLQSLSGKAPGPASAAVALEDCDRSSARRSFLILAAGTTGADGGVEFDAPPGDWYLRVRSPSHVDHVETLRVTAPTTVARVRVDVGAGLSGRVVPATSLERLRALSTGRSFVVRAAPADDESELPEVVLDIDDDGHFEAAGIAVGRYRITLDVAYAANEFQSSTDSWHVADLALTETQRQQIEIDARGFLPARVHGKVTVDGETLRGVHCFLSRETEAGGRGSTVRVGLDDDGRFESLVRPGEYRFSITLPADPGPGWIRMPVPDRTWQFTSDTDHDLAAALTLRRATLRVVDAAGEPLAGQRVMARYPSYHLATESRTDESGRARLDPAPPGPFHVRLVRDGEPVTLGPFDLPSGALDGEITVRVD